MNRPYRKFLRLEIPEETTTTLEIPIKDHRGDPLNPATVDAATLTLYDDKTGAVVNSVEDRDVNDANGGEWQADGTLLIDLSADDNQITDVEQGYELHVALVELSVGANEYAVEVLFGVRNLRMRP